MRLQFHSPPSALRYMAGAFVPKRKGVEFPLVDARWEGLRPSEALPGQADGPVHPVLLHAQTMRLMMAVLTHPRFPLPIWTLLQVRNRLVQHSCCNAAQTLTVEAHLEGSRVLEKGVEVDLAVRTMAADVPIMDSVTTFYARGRFGPPQAAEPARAPELPGQPSTQLSIEGRGARQFGTLTGDYNGVHWANRYARLFGLEGAFAHPHRALAAMVDRVPGLDVAQPFTLEVWFKGPVYYGRTYELAVGRDGPSTLFGARLAGDPRPAVVGVMTTEARLASTG
jgi:acyl dehydratase